MVDDDDTRYTWQGHAIKLVTDITLDPEVEEILYGSSILVRPPAEIIDTVLVEVPKDQLEAIRQAFPKVKVVQAMGAGHTGQIVVDTTKPSRPRSDWDKVPAFDPVKGKKPEKGGIGPFEPVKSDRIEVFQPVAGVIGILGKKGGGSRGF
jgi:hypothetical protein